MACLLGLDCIIHIWAPVQHNRIDKQIHWMPPKPNNKQGAIRTYKDALRSSEQCFCRTLADQAHGRGG